MTNKEIAKAWFAAIDKKDYDTLKGLLHPDHKFDSPMTPAPIGVDEHIGMIQGMNASFTGAHTLILVLEDETHAVVRGRWTGKHTGDFNGMPATGKNVSFTFNDIFEIVDGKIRKEAFEMNLMSMMMQIGAMPANA